MKIGVVADDFTGASDIAGTLAKAGAETVQYVGIPAGHAAPAVDAGVIALKSRSIPSGEAVRQSLAACRWLRGQGAEQIVFKICSTFDSTPEGNIGPVAEALLEELAAPLALVCPAFPANDRTVYQGHLFVGDRLLSQSGMERHPLNPMTESDLRRWLALQTRLAVGHLPLSALRATDAGRRLDAEAEKGAQLLIADAIADADALALARLAKTHRLVVGASAVAMGLPANFGIRPRAAAPGAQAGVPGPALILSGSCSAATQRQIARFRVHHPSMKIDWETARDAGAVGAVLDFIETHRDEAPLVYSTDTAENVAAAQARLGRGEAAQVFESLFGAVAAAAAGRGFRRIVAAGGETSGAVAAALGATAFRIGAEIAPGVPALRTLDEPNLALALKSGNFGGEDFFEQALEALDGRE